MQKKGLIKRMTEGKYNILLYAVQFFSFNYLNFVVQHFCTLNTVTKSYRLRVQYANIMYTFLWAGLFVLILAFISSKKAKRIVYGILYYFFAIYTIVQYGYYLIFQKFLFLIDLTLAGEGAAFLNFVAEILTPQVVLVVASIPLFGILGIILMPEFHFKKTFQKSLGASLLAAAMVVMAFAPNVYGKKIERVTWDSFKNPRYVYDTMNDATTAMAITGIYNYLFRDAYTLVADMFKDYSDEVAEIDKFFETKSDHKDNAYTGLLKGKNVILVLLETLDDWIVTKEDTPYLYKMMHEGVNFNQFYTPLYGMGYTFNCEFAVNSGVYAYRKGNTAYSLVHHDFSKSLANLFKDQGYRTASFHMNVPSFYNRASMHKTLGYSKYYSYMDYESDGKKRVDDSIVWKNNDIYNTLINKDGDQPFFSYILSFSLHAPNTRGTITVETALEKYPQYAKNPTVENIVKAKARMTDDMFRGLFKRLKKDGLFKDTVIIGFGDHYMYRGDEELVESKTKATGTTIKERTPAFIYSCDGKLSKQVNKYAQTVDLGPTVENLFGIKVPKTIMGHDILDPEYSGYVTFPNNSWLTKDAYVKNFKVVTNKGNLSKKEIEKMNDYITKCYEIDESILDSDYYKYKKEE